MHEEPFNEATTSFPKVLDHDSPARIALAISRIGFDLS